MDAILKLTWKYTPPLVISITGTTVVPVYYVNPVMVKWYQYFIWLAD